MTESRPKGYLEQSRDLTNSLILVAPVLVFYEVGLFLTGFEGLNGVDFGTLLVLHYGGARGLVVLNLAILVAIAIAAYVRRKDRSIEPGIVPFMLVESAVYALSLGGVISFVLRKIPTLGPPGAMSPLVGTVASLGAGVNEELFFRLGFLTLVAWTLEDRGGATSGIAKLVAAVVSSVAFSAAHYIAEPFELHSFLYRFLAGLIFSALFLGRGLAVAVYTHAIYDIYVIVLLGR